MNSKVTTAEPKNSKWSITKLFNASEINPSKTSKDSTSDLSSAANSNLVIKLAPQNWLLAEIATVNGKTRIENLIVQPLPHQVDPNQPNRDLELLQTELSKLIEKSGYIGRDVSILLPSSASVSNTYAVPFDLDKKVDLKEFRLSEQDKDFWQEFDPDVQDCKLPVFSSQYLGMGEESGTSQVFMAWANQELLNRYINLALSARLNPVALLPEIQGVLNVLVPQLDRLEQEGYFGILHIARGRSKIIAVSPERIATANINIPELDEELLDEIESVDDINSEFWKEVGTRFGGALRQAVLYLREQEGIPAFKNIYVISEAPVCVKMIELVKSDFTLGAIRSWQPLTLIDKNTLKTKAALDQLPNQTIWASLVGGGMLGLRAPELKVNLGDTPRYRLNLHPQHKLLYANRQFKKATQAINLVSLSVLALLLIGVLAIYVPFTYLYQSSIAQGQATYNSLLAKEQELKAIKSDMGRVTAQASVLNKANLDLAKSNFVMQLPGLMPSGIELSNLIIDDSSIVIEGYALSAGQAETFLNHIFKANLVKSPTIKISNPVEGRFAFLIEGQSGEVN